MRKYIDRKREEVDDYRVGDLVMLSTKDLKYQMVGRRTGKLTERSVSSYKIKKIISSNIVELELPSTVKIYPVVNISRIRRYVGQVERQKKEQPAPVIIEGEEECVRGHSVATLTTPNISEEGELEESKRSN